VVVFSVFALVSFPGGKASAGPGTSMGGVTICAERYLPDGSTQDLPRVSGDADAVYLVEGDSVRISYSSTGIYSSCSGDSGIRTPANSATYSVTCTGTDENGDPTSVTRCIDVKVLHYRVCGAPFPGLIVENASVPFPYPSDSSDTIDFRSYFDEGTGCSGTDVTAQTTFSSENDPNDAVTLSGTNPVSAISRGNDGIPNLHDPGQQDALERIHAEYPFTWPYSGSRTRNFQAYIVEYYDPSSCEVDCSFRDASQYCSDVGFRVTDTCGNIVDNACLGSRDCDFNWVEPSVPGL